MRLSRLYSNLPELFGPISFRPGLNVVLGEIRLPQNRDLSDHNLGKTKLANVIDFCLCRGIDKDFFLTEHFELFKDFAFFLEIETLDGQFVTIQRSVEAASKLSIAIHDNRDRDFADAAPSEWQHEGVAFDRGKQILDGLLKLTAIKPWDFRIPVGYALRTQSDFSDVFQLAKHKGKHRRWKPYVAHILGFDSSLVTRGFELAEQIEKLEQIIATLKMELGKGGVDLDQIRGLIEIKKKDVVTLEESTERFDFALEDTKINTRLVEELDQQIGSLNGRRYSLTRTRKRLLDSLQTEQIQFKPEAARKLFEEAGVSFPGQVLKEFEDLVRFNREISAERVEYLKAELDEVNSQLVDVAAQLERLNLDRQNELRFLGDLESMTKYRELNQRLVNMKNELASMERQRDALLGIREKDKQLRSVIREREDQVEELRANVDACGTNEAGRYWQIREALAHLCSQFLGHKALVTTRINKERNIDFHAEYIDQRNLPTSEADGFSYKQVLCAGFDLAVQRVMLPEKFLRFVFLDGLLGGLDPRTKLNIVEELRRLGDIGIQQILTVIDSDLPLDTDGNQFRFQDDEIVLRLHDDGENGRLFRMANW